MEKHNGVLDKRAVRTQMLAARDRIPEDTRMRASRTICNALLGTDWYAVSGQILVYAAVQREVDLSAFIEKAWMDGKELYFPKVNGNDMEFYRVDSWLELETGAFGVREPVGEERLLRMLPTLTPVLVPGVAFSRTGQRVGYGKGYYDRYLTANQKNKCLMAIGVAYSVQVVEAFDADDFDYPMQEVVTEKTVR